MKKTCLLTLGLLAGAMLFAQDNEPKLRTDMAVKPRIGFKAGVNLARLEIDDDVNASLNTDSKTSFHGSVFVNLPISAGFRVQPEIMYTVQGTKTSGVSAPNELSGINELDFHYVALPVMLQYWPGTSGFFVELGPQFSYLSSANGDLTANDDDVDLKDRNFVKKTDFAGGVGLGYLSRVGLGLNARYVHGFTNVWNADDAPSSTKNWEYSNRTVQISLIYHIGASK